MITIRPGSRVYELLSTLAYVGEFPMRSVRLLGEVSSWTKLILKLTQKQDFCIEGHDATVTCRMLTISGSGPLRSVRLYRAALPILNLMLPGAYAYYMMRYGNKNRSGKIIEIDRKHRVAETVAMCKRCNIETRPYELPPLQNKSNKVVVPYAPSFYSGRDLKAIEPDGINRTKFSRMTGAVFYKGGCYAMYNARDAVMNWNGKGETKVKLYLSQVARMNAGIGEVESAVLLGTSYDLGVRIMESQESLKDDKDSIDKLYSHIHFIPMNEFGERLLKILTIPDWNETLLDLLFESEDRTYNLAKIEADAIENDVYMYSFLDSDLSRLLRFRRGLRSQKIDKYEILCFEEQSEFLQALFGEEVPVRTIDLDSVEEMMRSDWSDADE